MSIQVQLDETKPLFKVIGRGELSMEEFLQALPQIQANEHYRADIPILWDLIDAKISDKDIGNTIKLWRISSKGVELAVQRGGAVKAAAVVVDPVLRQVVDAYVEITQGDELETMIFETLEDAESWLFK